MAIPLSDLADTLAGETLRSSPTARQRSRHRRAVRWQALVLLLSGMALVACQGWYLQPARRMGRALLAAQTGDLDDTEYELLELPGAAYEAHAGLLAAKLQIAKGQPNKAMNELALSLGQPETDLPALLLAGEAFVQMGRFIDAGKAWTLVVEQDPDNVEAHRRLAAAYYELGSVWIAAHHMREVIRLDPDDPRPYWLLAMIDREHGDAASAAAQFRAALERNPKPEDRLAIYLELAEVLHRLHQDQEALSLLDECTPNLRVWALRSECQFALGQHDEAGASLREALALDPSDRPAVLLKSRMAMQAGDPEAAADVLAGAVKLHDGSAAVHFALGQALRRLNRGDEAVVEERSAEALWSKEGQLSSQIEAAAEKPDDDELRFEIGRLAAEVDQPEMARMWLKAALLINPQHARARTLLERLSPMMPRPSPNGPRIFSPSAP